MRQPQESLGNAVNQLWVLQVRWFESICPDQ
jgi:hypothetical protein